MVTNIIQTSINTSSVQIKWQNPSVYFDSLQVIYGINNKFSISQNSITLKNNFTNYLICCYLASTKFFVKIQTILNQTVVAETSEFQAYTRNNIFFFNKYY